MELFDIIKSIFKSDSVWSKIGNADKNRNYFMINRIMSINFPVQADQFNRLKVNPYTVIDWWQRTLSKNYTRVPNWIYTKTNKIKKDKPAAKSNLGEFTDVELVIRDKFEISKRELSELKYFFPDKYKEWITSLKEQLSVTSK